MPQDKRAPRRSAHRPILVREVGTLRCWVAQIVDWSLTGSKLAGFPQRGALEVGASLELVEGLDVDSLEKLAPILSQPDLAKYEAVVERLRQRLGLRRSTGNVVRIEPGRQHFAIQFNEVSDDGRTYPKAHSHSPSLKAAFTYRNSVGTFSVKGNMTPGAAIDLAKDVVQDVRQCIVIVDLSAVQDVNRTAVEKFHTRLHSELDQQDLAYGLAVVSPEEWVRNLLEDIQTYATVKQAEESVRASLTTESERSADEPSDKDTRSEPSGTRSQSSDAVADKESE